ncbi:MAG TPA: DUF3368 domain-containing protein [Prosthecobacter sp.]
MIVVADTSVILNLCKVGHADLLTILFKEVWIPEVVRLEFLRLSQTDPRFQGLALPHWINVSSALAVRAEVSSLPGLHAGETAALTLALAKQADAVLMDEAAGRSAAKKLGLTAIGVLGILLQSKRSGLILAIRPVLRQLEDEAGFWLSAGVVKQALAQAGEEDFA